MNIGHTTERAREVLRRRGLKETAKVASQRLAPWSRWASEYSWSRLDLQSPERPRRPLADHFTLRRGTIEDYPLLEQLPVDSSVTSMSRDLVERRLDSGGQLWLVVQGDRAAFSCWNFIDHGPLSGAKDDTVDLPPGFVLLEDSLASPDFRGQGVAPGAWTGIADAQAAAGNAAIVTKVHVDNAASLRAVEKAGFVEFAIMRISGPVYRTRLDVRFTDDAPEHRWLAGIEQN